MCWYHSREVLDKADENAANVEHDGEGVGRAGRAARHERVYSCVISRTFFWNLNSTHATLGGNFATRKRETSDGISVALILVWKHCGLCRGRYVVFWRVLTSNLQKIDLEVNLILFGGPLCSIIMSPERYVETCWEDRDAATSRSWCFPTRALRLEPPKGAMLREPLEGDIYIIKERYGVGFWFLLSSLLQISRNWQTA